MQSSRMRQQMRLTVLIKGVLAARTQGDWVIASAGCHCMLDVISLKLLGSCQNELQEAGEAAYLLALSLCQLGQDHLAQPLLTRLGCSHRLAPALLQLCRHKTSAVDACCIPDASLPCVFQDALPGHLYQQLRTGLDQCGAFWSDHNYFEPQTPFFSYLYDLTSTPNTTIEATIQQLHSLLEQSPYGPCLAEATCAEWWAHCREPEEPHQLHFDMREAALRQGLDKYRLDHPILSSVLFLTAAGGPTVVLDQDPSAGLAERGWLVQPCPNQLLAFKGNLLHGVVPGRQRNVSAVESCPWHAIEKRVTLIVAWWGPGIRAEPGAPGQGPCRLVPHPKLEPYTLTTTETAQGPGPGPLSAGPCPRAEQNYCAPQDALHSQGHTSNSEFSATSAAESGSASEHEPAARAVCHGKSEPHLACSPLSALPDTESSYSELLWLQQCQLPPHQQQAFVCPQHKCHMLAANGLGDSADQVGPVEGGNSSTALPDRKVLGAAGSQGTCLWHPAARGGRPLCVSSSAKGYNPPTIAPVWLPVSHLQEEDQCDKEDPKQGDQQDDRQDAQQDDQLDSQQDTQQDTQQGDQQNDRHDCQHDDGSSRQDVLPLQEGAQPTAKRHKGEAQCGYTGAATYQQHVVLPLPPLRFFVRSADEILSVYQPRAASLASHES